MPRDAGDEIELFSNASLNELTSLFAMEETLHKQLNKSMSAAEKARILETGGIRKKAIEETYDFEAKKLKEMAEARVKQEVTVQERLHNMGKIANSQELEDKKNAYKIQAELQFKAEQEAEAKKYKGAGGKNNKEYKAWKKQREQQIKEEIAANDKILEDKFEKDQKYGDKLRKIEATKAGRENAKKLAKGMEEDVLGAGKTLGERAAAWKELVSDGEGGVDNRKAFVAITGAISDLAKKLENAIDTIGGKKGAIDTRLQGSKMKTTLGSYWDRMSWDITGLAGVSPYIKQETVVSNLEAMVKKGIAYNVEQRAFLQTLSEKIANTFNASDGVLLRLIRIQQADSTAARLGMESMLNAFLNNMYETSEYIDDLASSVRSSIEEAQALVDSRAATELEWQVQKWLGSMYSVGMSNGAVQGIANAFGQLIAGQIEGINNGGAGNLLIMAANEANLSIADILAEGLDSSKTNLLMRSMVNYLSKLYDNAKDSRVVQQQIANVYGLKASDLKAITNLAEADKKVIGGKNYTYQNLTERLYSMADTMILRTGVGEMLSNVWNNFQYTMAAGIANNPVLYSMYKVAGLLDTAVGGIPIPMISVMGNTVDLHTTVADLMRVASMSGGILQGIGAMITNLGAGGGFSGRGMIKSLEKSGYDVVQRGAADNLSAGDIADISESGYVGQSDSSSIKEQIVSDANKDSQEQLVSAEESSEKDLKNVDLNNSIVQIYDMLEEITTGGKALQVKISDNGGFTKGLDLSNVLGNIF